MIIGPDPASPSGHPGCCDALWLAVTTTRAGVVVVAAHGAIDLGQDTVARVPAPAPAPWSARRARHRLDTAAVTLCASIGVAKAARRHRGALEVGAELFVVVRPDRHPNGGCSTSAVCSTRCRSSPPSRAAGARSTDHPLAGERPRSRATRAVFVICRRHAESWIPDHQLAGRRWPQRIPPAEPMRSGTVCGWEAVARGLARVGLPAASWWLSFEVSRGWPGRAGQCRCGLGVGLEGD